MARYSSERKAAVLAKLLPPQNMKVSEVASVEGISEITLYTWRKQARVSGRPVPGPKPNHADEWSAEAKFATIIETASMTEEQLSEYCRSKGLYPDQISRWKCDSLRGFRQADQEEKALKKQRRADQAELKKLKRELKYKDKALAETTALLVLRKKLDALWDNHDEDD